MLSLLHILPIDCRFNTPNYNMASEGMLHIMSKPNDHTNYTSSNINLSNLGMVIVQVWGGFDQTRTRLTYKFRQLDPMRVLFLKTKPNQVCICINSYTTCLNLL